MLQVFDCEGANILGRFYDPLMFRVLITCFHSLKCTSCMRASVPGCLNGPFRSGLRLSKGSSVTFSSVNYSNYLNYLSNAKKGPGGFNNKWHPPNL